MAPMTRVRLTSRPNPTVRRDEIFIVWIIEKFIEMGTGSVEWDFVMLL
jgi:hypothetical protein